ncbi:hypothetical protein [Flavobacterium sp.]|jgi:hypothetical protein|uniref:hypothetical protein n=3 Tax=Flavobacterium sp. TaxID=239 RepID=UPI0022C97869|nr:hypothetical protein [Flavobacterium sp.]MCZ8145028.1 hypothetical protein [Flavobacterium sp.]MCZ8368030.1 hypothetical protein [Flavobacterium sp.]
MNSINPNKSNMNKPHGSRSFWSFIVITLTLFFTFSSEVFAQGRQNAPSVRSLDAYINGGNDPERTRLKDLVFEVQSSVYFFDNVVKTYGSTPVNVYTDFNGFIRLPQANFQKQTIELITIRIDEPSQIIGALNLNTLSSFTKLRYVYVLTAFPYTLPQISQVVTSAGTNYIVVFKSEPGS